MSLRTAPLPRMAGDLTYMRAKRATIEELGPDNLAVVGAPMERNWGPKTGCRFGPRAIRETSVYFGWHANPQFSHPVDVDARKRIDLTTIHDRLVDVGDVAMDDTEADGGKQAVGMTIAAIQARGAASILLGGDDEIVAPALSGLRNKSPCALIQIGGVFPPSGGNIKNDRFSASQSSAAGEVALESTLFLAPAQLPTAEFFGDLARAGGHLLEARQICNMSSEKIADMSKRLAARTGTLAVHLDLSALSAPLHGMSNTPRFDGLSVAVLQNALTAIGQAPVDCFIVTGLNPTLNGLSIVKTGQRLLVTLLLGFIYGRLGLLSSLEREGA